MWVEIKGTGLHTVRDGLGNGWGKMRKLAYSMRPEQKHSCIKGLYPKKRFLDLKEDLFVDILNCTYCINTVYIFPSAGKK
jgi:hypothetical protein